MNTSPTGLNPANLPSQPSWTSDRLANSQTRSITTPTTHSTTMPTTHSITTYSTTTPTTDLDPRSPLLLQFLQKSVEASGRIYNLVKETKLEHAQGLSHHWGQNIYLKREDHHSIRCFKIRGSYNKVSQLTTQETGRGVIACSAGNHGQGVALSAGKRNANALIVMPTHTPQIKVDKVKSLGGEVILHGKTFDEASQKAEEIAKETGRTMIHPFNDPDIIAGNGTLALEIIKQHSGDEPINMIFVPIGGGGLAAGVGSVIKSVWPSTLMIGVETEGADGMSCSLKAGEVITIKEIDNFVDGKAVGRVGDLTFKICQQCLDEILVVSNTQVCEAIQAMYEETRVILEAAGATSLAGMFQYLRAHPEAQNLNIICILSGANMDFKILKKVVEMNELNS